MTKTVIVTGATRGLGLAIARELARDPELAVVLAVRDVAAGAVVAGQLGGRGGGGGGDRVRVARLDVGSLADVARFCAAWDAPIAALVNNAGLQSAGAAVFTPEKIEQTVAVNWLGPLALIGGLRAHLAGGRVITIGSGTHDPTSRMARLFGFRGGRFTSIAELAAGAGDAAASDKQRAKDRYATSKLLVTAAGFELARRFPDIAFATLDPGLMPGTGLARDASWIERAAWSTLLRALVPVIPGASTTARSARAVCTLVRAPSFGSGEVFDWRAKPTRPLAPARDVWAGAREPALGAAILDQSLAYLTQRSTSRAAG